MVLRMYGVALPLQAAAVKACRAMQVCVQVELQAVAAVPLSFYRDEAAASVLADTVREHEGVLGASVCCGEGAGERSDDPTTCHRDRDKLLDRCGLLCLSASKKPDAAHPADTVHEHGCVLGACVCCGEGTGERSGDVTTCQRDRDKLLGRCDTVSLCQH